MGAAVNGMSAHGGILRPYGSTFLQFADYMRGSIRLSALMKLDVAWIFTHDSVALGEDGPTHQPIEHVMALRAIPGLTVLRPADANETAEAWRVIIEELEGPAAMTLSRQDLPIFDRSELGGVEGVVRGAYVLAPGDDAVIVATGGEVWVAVEAREKLAKEGVNVRVVSMPSWELFETQNESLPPRGAAARRADAVGRGRHLARLVEVRAGARGDRPLRRVGPGHRGAREARLHGRQRRGAAQEPAGLSRPRSFAASGPAVMWIAAGSRTQAMRFSACRRSSMNWNASAWRRERYRAQHVEREAGGVQRVALRRLDVAASQELLVAAVAHRARQHERAVAADGLGAAGEVHEQGERVRGQRAVARPRDLQARRELAHPAVDAHAGVEQPGGRETDERRRAERGLDRLGLGEDLGVVLGPQDLLGRVLGEHPALAVDERLAVLAEAPHDVLARRATRQR